MDENHVLADAGAWVLCVLGCRIWQYGSYEEDVVKYMIMIMVM